MKKLILLGLVLLSNIAISLKATVLCAIRKESGISTCTFDDDQVTQMVLPLNLNLGGKLIKFTYYPKSKQSEVDGIALYKGKGKNKEFFGLIGVEEVEETKEESKKS